MFKSASEVDSEYNSYVGRRARKQVSNKTIILMGSGSAGKTTVFKQIKKRYQKYE
jgi:tRNA A37 threonylcarbamoyladenosine biosynthesis protein TsaE